MLESDAIVHCVEETHSDENIAGGVPYPDAVETVREWHEQGHWIHVTSHRRRSTYEATAAWLDRIGMPYHDLHCSFDKVPRCVELEIDVLVDDSPVNITKARAEGSFPPLSSILNDVSRGPRGVAPATGAASEGARSGGSSR